MRTATKEVIEVSPAKRPGKDQQASGFLKRYHIRCGRSIPMSAPMRNTRSFTARCSMDYKEPLFWIHLNMDYPFNLKGILYFPKINTEYDSIEGTIKLYNNQVFIADNIKEVIPEFLMLLKGVIDCPDLPLNVSRSALQNDGFVKKISDYITKKVADKLTGMCKTDRENYEKYWDDISPFIKFGCIKDEQVLRKDGRLHPVQGSGRQVSDPEGSVSRKRKQRRLMPPKPRTRLRTASADRETRMRYSEEKGAGKDDHLLCHRRDPAEPVHQHVP